MSKHIWSGVTKMTKRYEVQLVLYVLEWDNTSSGQMTE